MSLRRVESGVPGLVRITTHSMSRGPPVPPFLVSPRPASGAFPICPQAGGPSSDATTPYPVTAVPGSIPRTITRPARDRSRRGDLRDVHVEVRVHLLHVVEILDRFNQFEQVLDFLALDVHAALRDPRELSAICCESALFERGLHGVQIGWRRRDD